MVDKLAFQINGFGKNRVRGRDHSGTGLKRPLMRNHSSKFVSQVDIRQFQGVLLQFAVGTSGRNIIAGNAGKILTRPTVGIKAVTDAPEILRRKKIDYFDLADGVTISLLSSLSWTTTLITPSSSTRRAKRL